MIIFGVNMFARVTGVVGDSAPLDATRGAVAPQSRNTGIASPSMLQDDQGRNDCKHEAPRPNAAMT